MMRFLRYSSSIRYSTAYGCLDYSGVSIAVWSELAHVGLLLRAAKQEVAVEVKLQLEVASEKAYYCSLLFLVCFLSD